MNTFLPYQDFAKSASVLDNKRLGKQRVECLQILKTLVKHQYRCAKCKTDVIDISYGCPNCDSITFKLTPWYNHPAVKMWRGYEWELHDYTCCICNEWTINRGFKDTCRDKLSMVMGSFSFTMYTKIIPWLTPSFCLSHQSNLIRKNPSYYIPIFGSDIPNNLPYIWPV